MKDKRYLATREDPRTLVRQTRRFTSLGEAAGWASLRGRWKVEDTRQAYGDGYLTVGGMGWSGEGKRIN